MSPRSLPLAPGARPALAPSRTLRRAPTIEWQVCGVCNYDCSYCIQSKAYRQGQPAADEVTRFLAFFQALPGRWEVKMSGGEPFASRDFLRRVVPGLIEDTPHTLSVLTNLSAPRGALLDFARLTQGRLGVISASLHLEFTAPEDFVEKAVALREVMDPGARLVINEVLVPGRLDEVERARGLVEAAGLRWFPQVLKTKHGTHDYGPERARVTALTGDDPDPRQANLAPSYRGRLCWTGVEYFVLTQQGDAWSCRTARRHGQGYLGNALLGSVELAAAPAPCPYDICPCTTPANRGMIEGVGLGRDP
ncbi:MAG: radical SAM protein [Planctomycetota bacterium]